MKKFKAHLFFALLLFGLRYLQAQCTFTVQGKDYNLPAYFSSNSGYVSMVRDTAGNIYVASTNMNANAIPVVHKYDGISWQQLGAIANTGCSNLKIAVTKSGTPFIAFRDGINGLKLSVMTFTNNAWVYVGPAGFSPNTVWTMDIEVDKNGVPIVAYEDQTTSASVVKYNGTSWVNLGTQFVSTNYVTHISLELDTAEVPYIGYCDGATFPKKATVRKLSSGSWVLVGPQLFSLSETDYTDIEFDRNNNLYIAYSDHYYSERVTVRKFNSTTSVWANVGNPGFTTGMNSLYTDLAIDTLGQLYVISRLLNNTTNPAVFRANVKKFDGTNWVDVGPTWNVSEKDGTSCNIIIDKSNKPLVCYTDQNRHYKVAVKKFSGTQWNFIGDKGFSIGVSENHSLALDKYGVPYVCFSDSINGHKASVMKYVAGSWTHVGTPGFSPGTASMLTIKFDASNTPYISFIDGNNLNTASVMKYNGTSWNYVGSPGFSAFSALDLHMTIYQNVPYVVATNSVTFNREIYACNSGTWSVYASFASFFTGGFWYPQIGFDSNGFLYYLSSSSSGINVSRYSPTTWWMSVGSPGGTSPYPSLEIDKYDNVYVALADASAAQKMTVKKRVGNTLVWTPLGSTGFSQGTASQICLHAANNGALYLAYSDVATQRRANLLKYNGTSWVSVFSNSVVTAGAAVTNKLAVDSAGNVYHLFKSTESYMSGYSTGSLSISGGSLACSGQSVTLTASGVSGYTWSTGSNNQSIVVSPTSTTSYFVNVAGVNNCTLTAASTIQSYTTATVSVAGQNSVCAGSAITLTASGASSYSWNSVPGSAIFTVSPGANTVYSVSGSNSGGYCPGSATFSVSVSSSPTLQVTVTSYSPCQNTPFNVTVSGASTYSYNGASMLQNPMGFPSPPSGFTLSGTSAPGCSATAVVTLNVLPAPATTIVSTHSPSLCVGQTATLTAFGAQSYQWNVNGSTAQSLAVSPATSTMYTVIGTHSNGCSTSHAMYLQVNPPPPIFVTAAKPVFCYGVTNTLTAYGAASFTWNASILSPSVLVHPTVNITYSVVGSSVPGCISSTVFAMAVNPLPTISVVPSSTLFCAGQSYSLSANGASTYTWGANPGSSLLVITPFANATYSVTGSDPVGCANSAVFSLTVTPGPTVSASSSGSAICAGESATLTSSGATTYSWNTGANGASLVVSPTALTVYTVTGFDLNGCYSDYAFTQLVDPCTSVASLSQGVLFSVYPNPGNGLITVELPETRDDQTLEVWSLTGQLVYRGRVSGLQTIDLRDLSAGVYIFRINTSGKPASSIRMIKN